MRATGSLCHRGWVKSYALRFRDIHQPSFSAKLEGCILGRYTRVGTKAELVRTLTQAGYEVDTGGMDDCP
jgi:hypothetical protein